MHVQSTVALTLLEGQISLQGHPEGLLQLIQNQRHHLRVGLDYGVAQYPVGALTPALDIVAVCRRMGADAHSASYQQPERVSSLLS